MSDDIYNGFWTNWQYGKFRGATLTLPSYSGLILVSFLTLFVQFSGACFWRVICFVLHQSRSKPTLRDGLFHQQQTILRNSITAPNALWTLASSAVAWRGRVKAPLKASLPLLIATIIHLGFFTTAGLFSSRVTTTASAGQALMTGANCGFPDELDNLEEISPRLLNASELRTFNTQVLLGRVTLTKSAAYVRSCYNQNNNGASGGCNLYVQPHLDGVNASAVTNASCPFGNDACITPHAARYDSGALHSNKDLGINYPKTDALTIRRITTFAPVRAERYATGWRDNVPEAFGGGQANTSARYYEMGSILGNENCEFTTVTTNQTTFCVTQYMKDHIQEPYTLRAMTAYYGNSDVSNFAPIADFQVDNADVTLLSVFNSAIYSGKVTDPLFNAQNKTDWGDNFFGATTDLSILGCVEQYQLCNPRNSRCTPVTGLYGMKKIVDSGDLDLSNKQLATAEVLYKSAWAMGLQWSIKVIGSELLLARDWVWTTGDRGSSSLTANHWEDESLHLHNLALAVLQRRVSEFASPTSFEIRPGLNSLQEIKRPTDPNLLDLCFAQKMRTSEHYSVSVLGMAIILGVGGMLILLDWVLIQQIFWWRSVTHARGAKKEDWLNSGTLQLHKSVLESKGVGPWEYRDFEIPVLEEKGRKFARMGEINVHYEMSRFAPQNYGVYNGPEHGGYGMDYDGGHYAALHPQPLTPKAMDAKT